jgi:hypothetical protein
MFIWNIQLICIPITVSKWRKLVMWSTSIAESIRNARFLCWPLESVLCQMCCYSATTNYFYQLQLMKKSVQAGLRCVLSRLSLKYKVRYMTSRQCLCLCPHHQLFNQLVKFYKIQYAGHATEGDLDFIFFNLVA